MKEAAVFLTGATGYLGHEVAARLIACGIEFQALGRRGGFDLLDPFGLATRFERVVAGADRDPVLLHIAAMSRNDACEAEPEVAWRANMEATGALASVLQRRAGRMVYVSTDLVFDGEHAPYDETAEARPAAVYPKSKRGGEQMVLGTDRGLVVRIPLLWGPSFDGTRGASDSVLAALRAGRELRLFRDEWRTPLHVGAAARGLIDLLQDTAAAGIRHLPGPESLSRYDLGVRLAEEAGLDASAIVAASRLEHPGPPRPRDCSLATTLAAGDEG